ncbi:TetR/AcrR family transcriptional regulator [Lentzea sp. CC55]|uniref:TetR/AcrR family transcriptional regulator n=1 Tax=Lentzea sp. CC55 TaxID=2884909 RepID=UPI0027DEFB20|nr:TetR family transcriptional regulator [Lentzea sp. CC55]MCG8927368.1 TetR family transcriptional regulator [Lentzea sp. CC55]
MGRKAGRSPEETRRLILDAAFRVVLRKGIQGSLDDVAAEAGLSRGAVVYHFSSKKVLWVEVAREALTAFREQVVTAAEQGEAPGRLARALIAACLDDEALAMTGERLQLLSALAPVDGVGELASADAAAWRRDLAADGLRRGAIDVVLTSLDGAGITAVWGGDEVLDQLDLPALREELEKLTLR